MKAVAVTPGLQVEDPRSFQDTERTVPIPGDRDLLVKIEAISVNPIDTKVRRRSPKTPSGSDVIGWDAAGTVVAIGKGVSHFTLGDHVYYAGSIQRPGANAEYHLVDERIAARMPQSLSFAEAAALPLTALTAWETLFHNFQLPLGLDSLDRTVLVGASAGGVGSMALQLARVLTNAQLIGTASRQESSAWAKSMGAHHVVDHRSSLIDQVHEVAPDGVTDIISSQATDLHFSEYAELLAPRGKITILDSPTSVNILELKGKSVSLHWENVFTRPVHQTSDMKVQGRILEDVARLVDSGLVRTTLRQEIAGINAANLRTAHEVLESGTQIGKLVLTGF
ncbi:zinc-binding alcohol dehydrogenase family protein [Arthrobacter sp. AFG20]|nr:zinc-binding alcohol dehydrogenase family protein [Arthrobacter sp. AFG20]